MQPRHADLWSTHQDDRGRSRRIEYDAAKECHRSRDEGFRSVGYHVNSRDPFRSAKSLQALASHVR